MASGYLTNCEVRRDDMDRLAGIFGEQIDPLDFRDNLDTADIEGLVIDWDSWSVLDQQRLRDMLLERPLPYPVVIHSNNVDGQWWVAALRRRGVRFFGRLGPEVLAALWNQRGLDAA